MTLKRKIRTLRNLKADVQRLEREILEEGFAKLQQPNQRLLMKPRIERVMEIFG
jgi:hypothetical protein